jgi:hypothetical protein
MSQYADDFFKLRGRVLSARPMNSPDFVNNALNDRLRQILDHRTFWADLLTFGNLSFPDPYATGTVSMTYGDATIVGVGTAWPVSDKVNTTIPDGVPEFGYVEVVPASMAGITANSMLLVDAAGDPEIVPVVQVNRTSFIANFSKQHNDDCAITQSSLANLQFRISQAYPVFTVTAVTSPTSLEVNLPWGGPSLADQTYAIKLMYVMLASDLKAIVAMKDEQTGFPVRLHVSIDEANYRDPRRTLVSGNPLFSLVDLGANDQGNMLYEAWPAPASARQWSYAYNKQWPEMVKDTDRPPPFINPSILFYGALADAKMMRTSKDDPYYDPQGAQWYQAKFEQGVAEAKNSDEAKKLEAMRNPWWKSMMPGSYDQMQLTDPAVAAWDFGGGGLYY